MTKRNDEETLCAVCDALVTDPVYSHAARRAGVAERTLFRWMRDIGIVFEWNGEVATLGDHMRTAMRLNLLEIEATARFNALHGSEEKVFYQGRPMWEEDEDIVNSGITDPDVLEMLFNQRDRYKRDENGNRIQLTIRRKPSDALVLKMLSSHFPRVYGDKVEMNHSGIIGVVRVGNDGRMNMPKQIEHKQDDDALDFIEPADGQVPEEQKQIGLVVGEPARSSEEFEAMGSPAHDVVFEDDPADAPDWVKQQATSSEPMVDQPHQSELVRDLKARLAARPKNPHPQHPVFVGKPEDEPSR